MATKKPSPKKPIRESAGSVMSTVSGPSSATVGKKDIEALDEPEQQLLAKKVAGTQAMAARMPDNPLKPSEFGLEAGQRSSRSRRATGTRMPKRTKRSRGS